MRTSLTIAAVELRRFLKDRSNIFFVFVFPLVLVTLIGAQFGETGGQTRMAVVGEASELRTDLVAALEDDDVRAEVTGRGTALQEVARNRADAAILVDPGAAAAYEAGDPLEIVVVPSSQLSSRSAVQRVQVVLEGLSGRQGQLAALTDRGVEGATAREALDRARSEVSEPRLEIETSGELAEEFEGLGRFDFGASGQLLLFVFLSSLTGSTTLIQGRRLGVVGRTLAAPVTARGLVLGQVLGRFAIAIVQGAWIMLGSSLLFGVDWGDLRLSVTVLGLFALVSAGAAMLLGATVDNEGVASGIGIGGGLVLAALGGSMMPLELFPETMRAFANLTPHAWAYEALADIQRRGAGFTEVLPQMAVLAVMAVALVALGAWALRRSLARAM